MKQYDTLTAADIYRDGGSLEARFRCNDGTFESLWLSVLPEDSTYRNFVYGALRIVNTSDRAEHGRIITKGSDEEIEIRERLAAFLNAPKIGVQHRYDRTDDNFLNYVRNLAKGIQNRKR